MLSCYCCVEIPYECQMSMGNKERECQMSMGSKEPNGSPLQSMGEENALGFVSYFWTKREGKMKTGSPLECRVNGI